MGFSDTSKTTVDHLRLVTLPHPLFDWWSITSQQWSTKVISSKHSSQWWKAAGPWHQHVAKGESLRLMLDSQDCYLFFQVVVTKC